jgi:1-acyl-sn-glycerol-3-phosphate acyltransferase
MLDIPLLLGYLPFKFHFILKDSLMKIPIFGLVLRALNFYPINRSDARQAKKTLDFIVSRITKGENVLIFPEGTRSRDGKIAPFKKGALRLAEASGADILPIAIKGTFDLSVKGSRRIRRAPVSLTIGELIKNPGDNILNREFNQMLEDRIRQFVNQ